MAYGAGFFVFRGIGYQIEHVIIVVHLITLWGLSWEIGFLFVCQTRMDIDILPYRIELCNFLVPLYLCTNTIFVYPGRLDYRFAASGLMRLVN
jgi:hypothetical protein